MVRKKTNSTKKASVFASPGKVLMLQKNRLSGTPQNTPKSSQNSTLRTSNASQYNKSINLTIGKSLQEVKRRKVNQTLRAMREIKKFQSSTKLLIPRAPFSRVVREIAQNVQGTTDIRFTALSLMALQEAAEMAIVNLLEIANLCCLHAKRVTLAPSDIRLTRRAFGLTNALNG